MTRTGAAVQLALPPTPPLPPPIAPGLRLQCLPGALPAAYGYPVAELVSVGTTRVAVRVLGEPAAVRRIPPRLLAVFLPPLQVWHGYKPACIRTRHAGGYSEAVPAPGWAWIGWTLAEHLRGDLDPAVDLAPGERLPDPADVHPDDLGALALLRTAPPAERNRP